MASIYQLIPKEHKNINGILNEGDKVPVVIKEVDEKKRINLSIKEIDPKFAEKKGFKPDTGNGKT